MFRFIFLEQHVPILIDVLRDRVHDGFAESEHELHALRPILHARSFKLVKHLEIPLGFFDTVIEHGLNLLRSHQMREAHHREELGSDLVAG